MKNSVYIYLLVLLFLSVELTAQNPMRRIPGMSGIGRGASQGQDSLKRRDSSEDSITIRFRYLDTSRLNMLDSSITDFRKRFPIPVDYAFLGNLGQAARPYGFAPRMESGWDHGFHAFDIYKYKPENVRFFQTTRPYSELGYLLGSNSEQSIHLLHTQNIQPNWNFALQYGLINAPGLFKNQNTNHNRYLFNTDYHSNNRRYNLYFMVLSNSMQANENGGIKNNENYLDNVTTYEQRVTIPVNLGDYVQAGQSFLNSSLNTGNKQRSTTMMLRQQYDLGKRDSIVTDSNVVQLFYPKFRMEYNLNYSTYKFRYYDSNPDTPFYTTRYDFLVTPASDFSIEERWSEVINDFSLYSFPDSKNPQQFLKAGLSVQNLTGQFDDGKRRFYNLFGHGEYRNKTRNKKWDIEAYGKLYFAGLNNGDFNASGSLKRYISKNIGYAQLGLQNVNRTPSYIYETASSFSFGNQPGFNKENTTRVFGSLENDLKRWRVGGSYYLVSNYTFFRDFYKADQASGLFNVVQVDAEKTFRLSKTLHWLARVQLNQRIGDGPVNLPLLFTFHQFGFTSSLGFKNLLLSTGIEARYHTAYKAAGYSPLQSQFFYQDEEEIRLELPDVAAYLNFRIRGFAAYLRAENLNTARIIDGSFGFTNHNLAAPNYPYPGLQIRLGIFWSFVN
ncbi:putative porin [Flavihumibacter sp.]|uniref:putative porin n=1 Tax=Flavihumibacter sp. TaxID=1913981 RepID=UPI002FC60CD9